MYEGSVRAKITGNRLGFVRKVKKASIRARGSKGVPVGEGKGEGGEGEGVKMEERYGRQLRRRRMWEAPESERRTGGAEADGEVLGVGEESGAAGVGKVEGL